MDPHTLELDVGDDGWTTAQATCYTEIQGLATSARI